METIRFTDSSLMDTRYKTRGSTVMAATGEAFETTFDSCVRGFHAYQDEWTPMRGEILPYKLFIWS